MLDLNNSEDRYLALNAIRAADMRHLWRTPVTAADRREIPEDERMPKPIAVYVEHQSEDIQPDEEEYAEREKLGFPGWYYVSAHRPGKKDRHNALQAEISDYDDEEGISKALLACGVEELTPVLIWGAGHGWSGHEASLIGIMLVRRA